jgi:N6-L-threonylcarbamoyladenine synthase
LIDTKSHQHIFNFSFSGLKTAVRRQIEEITKMEFHHENSPPKMTMQIKADICASIQFTIIEILMDKLKLAVAETGINQIAIGGGVSANSGIRATLKDAESKYGWKTFIPKFEYTTDNAAMIGIVGYQKYLENKFNDAGVVSKARIEF